MFDLDDAMLTCVNIDLGPLNTFSQGCATAKGRSRDASHQAEAAK